jgi:hypothetical protein
MQNLTFLVYFGRDCSIRFMTCPLYLPCIRELSTWQLHEELFCDLQQEKVRRAVTGHPRIRLN